MAIGPAIGAPLLLNLGLQSGRRSYSQLRLAGSLEACHASGIEASQLQGLIGYPGALAYGSGVMALSLAR